MENEVLDDDLFAQYAQQQQKEAEQRAAKGSGNSNFSFETIKWSGLQTNNIKIIRAVGGPPNSTIDEFTAKTIRVSWIIGDDKKKFRCILPEAADAPDHLLWNIIARVKGSEWVEGQRVVPVERDFPEIYNIVHKNGLSKADRSWIFDRGWTGRNVLLMNVIDREMQQWHQENKHTALLSRSIGIGKDGAEFPETGVPSYGFSGLLANLFKFYGNWEKYDIGITRTGLKEAPYRVINASKYIEETGDKGSLVSNEPLSDEERNYERYDLNKLFQITSYTKIYNHLKGKIARIDSALDTNFLEELKFLVEKEKKEREERLTEEKQKEVHAQATDPIVLNEKVEVPQSNEGAQEATAEAPAPVTRTRTVVAGNDFSKLKGWDALTQQEKDGIESVNFDAKPIQIVYKDKNATLLACPDCLTPAPSDYNACAVCGLKF